MNTVFTPKAIEKMIAAGTLRKIRLSDLTSDDKAEESFYFRFPSSDIVNEFNGDGDFLEILDYTPHCDKIFTSRGAIETTPDTEIYVK